jgi:hypothetical protein
MVYRGNPVDKPCLRLLFSGGSVVDVVLHDIATRKMLTADRVRALPSSP